MNPACRPISFTMAMPFWTLCTSVWAQAMTRADSSARSGSQKCVKRKALRCQRSSECPRPPADDRAFALPKKRMTAALRAVAANDEQDVHAAFDEIVHRPADVHRAADVPRTVPPSLWMLSTRSALSTMGPSVRRIKSTISVAEAHYFLHPVNMVHFQEGGADHGVHAGTKSTAGDNAGAGVFGIEEKFFARAGQLEKEFLRRRDAGRPHNVQRDARLVTGRVWNRRREAGRAEPGDVYGAIHAPPPSTGS